MRNWVEWLVAVLFCLCLIAIGVIVFCEASSPTFDLKKDEWTCAKSHVGVRLMPLLVGKTTIMQPQPYTVCDEYKRND